MGSRESSDHRHARKYLECRNKGSLLNRYANGCFDDQKMCHVCAWVAYLPESIARCRQGSNGLSPVSLLVSLTRRCPKTWKQVTPRLRKALKLVEFRSQHVVCGARDGPWYDLRHAVARMRRKGIEDRLSKKHDNNIATFEQEVKSLSVAERSSLLDALEMKTEVALGNWDPIAAVRLLDKSAAYMSAFAICADSVSEEKHSKRNNESKSLQSRLSTIFITLMEMLDWSDTITRAHIRAACAHVGHFFRAPENASEGMTFAAVAEFLWSDVGQSASPVRAKGKCASPRVTEKDKLDARQNSPSDTDDGTMIFERCQEDTTHKTSGVKKCLELIRKKDRCPSFKKTINLYNRQLSSSIKENDAIFFERCLKELSHHCYPSAALAVQAIKCSEDIAPGTQVDFMSTRGDRTYTLTLSKQEPPHWYCSCPSWKFQSLHPRDRTCKHMEGLPKEDVFTHWKRRRLGAKKKSARWNAG